MAVYINGNGGAVCSAGWGVSTIWDALLSGVPAVVQDDTFGPLCRLSPDSEQKLEKLRVEKKLKEADRAVLLGVAAAREAFAGSGLDPQETAVIVGSSRGATHTLEREHDSFLHSGEVSLLTSPYSTPGCFASMVAQDLACHGPAFFVSSACSTGLNAIGAAFALIRTGVAGSAVAGGAESSLTSFTLKQFRTLGLLAKKPSILFPAKPMHPERSGLLPGEGAACVALTATRSDAAAAVLSGFGSATEPSSATGISPDGLCLVRAIHQALASAGLKPGDIDLIVGHGSATPKGDAAELAAYKHVFGEKIPPATFNKWLFGHTLGASAALSFLLGVRHLTSKIVPGLPYYSQEMELGFEDHLEIPLMRHVLVCALGFGGAASAAVVSTLDPV